MNQHSTKAPEAKRCNLASCSFIRIPLPCSPKDSPLHHTYALIQLEQARSLGLVASFL